MGIFSWFRKTTRPEDYEGVLARLATEINDAKLHLSEVRLRERRYSLLLNAYGVGLWAIWFGLWWFQGIPWGLIGWYEGGSAARAAGVGGVVAGPILIVLFNQLIRIVFRKIRTSEETNLRMLLAKQRKQVDEIKKATNFDTTRKLLEQYDAMNTPPQGQLQQQQQQRPRVQTPGKPGQPGSQPGSSPTTPQRGSNPASPETPGAPGTPSPVLPRSPGGFNAPSTPVPLPPGMTPEQAALFTMQLQAIQPILPTPEKKWYDRLADSILGDDPAQAANSKYALVCAECFRHNGLVGNKYEWERMQWICPRCAHLNPAPLSRMQQQPQIMVEEPETPSKPARTKATAPASAPVATPPAAPAAPHLRPAPAPRRRLGERAAPRQSRLGTEVFSAADAEAEEENSAPGDEGEDMEVDDN